jgi:glycosyltransferase involved in cell wall biosynthesis
MRIVHLASYFTIGRGYQEYFLAREQIKSGHKVFVVTSDRCSCLRIREKIEGKKRIIGHGVFQEEDIVIHRLPVLFEIYPRVYLKNLKKTLDEIRPDVVHCHGVSYIHALQAALIKRKSNFRLVYDDHAMLELERKSILGKLFYLSFRILISGVFLKAADAFVAVTEDTKIFMNKNYDIPLDRIHLIHLGADSDLFRFNMEDRLRVRAELGINANEILLISTGKIIESKNTLELLQSSAELLKNGTIRKILLIGDYDEDYKIKLDGLIAREGIKDKVIFKEFVPNSKLYKYYSAADIGVWPGSPTITTLEASSCGLPIIIKEQPASMGMRISNNNGFAYKQGDPHQLNYYIKLLATNVELRKQMGQNGRKLIEDKLSWKKINQQFMDVYSNTKQKNGMQITFFGLQVTRKF